MRADFALPQISARDFDVAVVGQLAATKHRDTLAFAEQLDRAIGDACVELLADQPMRYRVVMHVAQAAPAAGATRQSPSTCRAHTRVMPSGR
jgi:hypothetical protein